MLELVGIKNILTKCIGTTNAHNVVKATMNGLLRLKTREQIRQLRQIPASAPEPTSSTPEPAPIQA